MSSVALSLILEKIASKDKDFRYMATSDLSNELAKEHFRFDSTATEQQVSDVIIKQLDDQSSDISSLANKCLGLLVNKTSNDRLKHIVSTLINNMLTVKKEQQRDVASLAMKTTVAEVAPSKASILVETAAPLLMTGISSETTDISVNSVDILTELASRYGQLLPDQEGIKNTLAAQLEGRAAVRKRVVHCLAALASSLPADSLNSLCVLLLDKLEATSSSSSEKGRIYVQAVAALSRSIGYKLGPHLGRAIPLCCARLRAAEEGDDETREVCIQALEGFVQRAASDAKDQLKAILDAALEFLRYDPNYVDDDEMDEDGNESGSEEEEDADDDASEEEEYSDDEDTSWKIRRACAKLVSAVVEHYPDLIKELYPTVAPVFLGRFKEREETVRCDVLATYADVIRQTGQAKRRGDTAAVNGLNEDASSVVKALAKQLKGKSVKAKVAVFKVLNELVGAVPDTVSASVGELVPGIKAALADKSTAGSSLKIQTLQFLNAVISNSNQPAALQAAVADLGPLVFAAASDRYYKVGAEALRCCEKMVGVIRPDVGQAVPEAMQPLIPSLFELAKEKLAAQDQDQDQEVKEAAICCSAALVANLGDLLPEHGQQVGKLADDFAAMPNKPATKKAKTGKKTSKATAVEDAQDGAFTEMLNTLLDRMRNEITRLSAVRALTTIARSPLAIDLSPVFSNALQELTALLRKANRTIRQSALVAVDALVARDGVRADPQLLENAAEEGAALVNDNDLAITAQALHFAVTLLTQQTRVADAVCSKFMPRAVTLLKSPLLQGTALQSLQTFFSALASSGANTEAATVESLLATLREAATDDDAGRPAQLAAARCGAVLCQQAGQTQVDATARSLLDVLTGKSSKNTSTVRYRRFALLSLGELGRTSDLTAFDKLPTMLAEALSEEEIADAASLAFGGVASGNLPAYLPMLLQQVQAQNANPKLQYQLLKALNEVITTKAHSIEVDSVAAMTADQQNEILQLLLSSVEREEECRAVVAECLGHLALLGPDVVLPAMHAALSSQSVEARTVAVSALRHAAIDREHPIDATLPGVLPAFLSTIGDGDRHVRKAGLQLLASVARSKPSLLNKEVLGPVVPLLFQQIKVDKSLIRIVDLGPFKHQIDDGLELRVAAYECLDVLLDRCAEGVVQPGDVSDALIEGVADHYDVKMHCHLLLTKLSTAAPGAVASRLERFIPPFTATLTARVKTDAVQQEIDRNEDMLRSCLRAIHALTKVPSGSSGVGAWRTFMDSTVSAPGMKERYLAIKEERKEGLDASGGDPMDLS